MSSSVVISSVNYNGKQGTITFTPSNGLPNINIGTVNLPYTYNSDYVYGSYSIYFPQYNKTCTVVTPTPTVTLNILGISKGCASTGLGAITTGLYRINSGGWISLTSLNSTSWSAYYTLATITVPYGTNIDVCFPLCTFGTGYFTPPASAGLGTGDFDSRYGYQYVRTTATLSISNNIYFNLLTSVQ
jgi:hypothetical protein